MRIITYLIAFLSFQSGIAQSIGIGTASPHPSAGLEIKSTNQGILVPRLTAAQRSTINNPATGLLVFQTDGSPGFYYYAGGGWINLTNGINVNSQGIAVSSSYGVTTTLAGNGSRGDVDGVGTAAQFEFPSGVAVDASGNIYVADEDNNEIRKITASGVVTTIAGNSTSGETDGPAAQATFRSPAGVAVDAAGNIYVADMLNNKIRKISNGQVSTLAGRGPNLPGDADGAGTDASFNWPSGITIDASGNLYVADSRNNKIRKITQSGLVSTLAGNSTGGDVDGNGIEAFFEGPRNVAVDIFKNVYVADYFNNKIRKIDSTGMVSTLAGLGPGSPGEADGPVATASFYRPTGIAIDAFGNVYVAETNNKIRKISPAGMVSTLAGRGQRGYVDNTGPAAAFALPAGVAVDASGNVYVADQFNHAIRKIIAQ